MSENKSHYYGNIEFNFLAKDDKHAKEIIKDIARSIKKKTKESCKITEMGENGNSLSRLLYRKILPKK